MPRIIDGLDDGGLWPADPGAAATVQERLAGRVRTEPLDLGGVSLVAGLDVSYAPGDTALVAAAVVMDPATLEVVDSAVAATEPRFPYVPGLFAFRELPSLLKALEGLGTEPDAYVCDGFGLAHPRRFGLACHLGVLLDRPVLGAAKSAFVGRAEAPGPERGSWTPLLDGGEVVGRSLRTRAGVKPVFVSVGHRVDLDSACELLLRLTPRYRIPEPIRRADRLSRDRLAEASAAKG
ncbi:deoxyribonuclease V [Spinactinospora alkalitolerans]|uniref:Endonuclease V n=1 Tax=Spinactinospora alkalitolerans TaxID=687207 RepID=A0A852TZ48_9ACTN|nr:endonuclease V [Spinactinospora alkalitolerans]NYE48292.1 deoxyribonuclease V [Spinactinospora alkalitolerans]